jgi:tRNA nucleotidyltransferase/poly(A) polymerase
MLRAVQFASRFGFTIEPETMKMIQENAGRVKEIAPERILTEFEKIVRKGNILTGAILLNETGLLKEIFGKGLYYDFRNTKEPFDKVRTIGEFVYLLSKNLVNDPAEFFKTNFKGDENTYKEIKALQLAFDSGEATNLIEARSVVHNMYIISPISLQSQILPNVIMTAAKEFLAGKYPKTVNELAVNGNDLMQAGLQGKAIGDMQKSLLLKIYANKVMNNKEDLLSLAKENGR